jgi:hypothetical protein
MCREMVMAVIMVMMEDELDELSGLLTLGAHFRFACTAVAYGVVGSLDRLLLALGAVHRSSGEDMELVGLFSTTRRRSGEWYQRLGVVRGLYLRYFFFHSMISWHRGHRPSLGSLIDHQQQNKSIFKI